MSTAKYLLVISSILFLSSGLFGQREFKKMSFSVNVPSKIRTIKKTVRFENNKTTTSRDTVSQVLSMNLTIENVVVSGKEFYGFKKNSFSVYDEVYNVTGTFSEDKTSIKKLNISYNKIQYNIPNRAEAHIEETKRSSITLIDVPKPSMSYEYNPEVTEIKQLHWEHYRFLKYRAISETTVRSALSVDYESFTKWTKCVRVTVREPRNINEDLDTDKKTYSKVAVRSVNCEVPDHKESLKVCGPIKGLVAKIVSDLSKVPGLSVLERENIDRILEEQELSESGLVEEGSRVESGRIIEEDLLIEVELQKSESDSASPEVFEYKVYVLEKATGTRTYTNLYFKLHKDRMAPGVILGISSIINAYILDNYIL